MKGEGEYNALEQDADRSAVGAVASLWSQNQGGLKNLGRSIMPRLASGLQLSRCNKKATPSPTAAQAEKIEINVQPVSVANDDGKNPTTVPSLGTAQAIWGKCCVTLKALGTKQVSKTAFRVLDEDPATDTFTPTTEERDLMAAAGAGGGTISVIVPETFKNGADVGKNIDGGGVTYMPNKADATCFLVEGSDPSNVAHELGHAMGNGAHISGTVMEGSGAFDKPNPSTVSPDICDTVRKFAFGTKSGKTDCSVTTP